MEAACEAPLWLEWCPPDVWEAVFLRLDVPTLWRAMGVCRAWRERLDERFWKLFCALRGWDWRRWLDKQARRERKAAAKAERKGVRKRKVYLAFAGVYPFRMPVRLFARKRHLKMCKRAMLAAAKPAAVAALRDRQLKASFGGNTVAFLSHVLSLDPDLGPALNRRALLLLGQDNHAEARRDLEHAVRLFPNFGDALNNLGLACHELGDPEAALRHYSRALALEGDAVTYNNRGLALNDLARHAEAVADFTTILEKLNPRHVDALNNRAFSYNSLGCYEEAAADCAAALVIKPHLAEPRRIRAFAWYKLGRYADAVQEASHAIELFGSFYAKAHYTRGLALAGLAEQMPEGHAQTQVKAKAEEDMRAARDHTPDVDKDL